MSVLTTRSQQRLADELDDDGITLAADVPTTRIVIEELDYCRRTPMFEGRTPIYGAIITPNPAGLATAGVDVELVAAPADLREARVYADGRASYVVRSTSGDDPHLLACFERSIQYEADLVILQEATGALVVQRTPVLAVTRLFQPGAVVSWNGRCWSSRPTANSLLPALLDAAPDLDRSVAYGVLELALHWLSPARAGATLVIHDGQEDDGSFDKTSATQPPVLDVTDRRHLPPLLSSLMQRDLATFLDAEGKVIAVGVGLRSSPDAESRTATERGMRHRSAQRWSHDHPDAVVTVVSSDGPVTIFRNGAEILDVSSQTTAT